MGLASRRLHDEQAAAPEAAPFWQGLWISPGLIAAILFVYAQVWYFDLVNYDDVHYLRISPHVANGLTLPGIKWALTTLYFVNWHPLTWFSYMLDVEIFGLNAGGFHATNVLLHAVSTLLLFRILRRLTDAQYPSAFVAVLFAVHPLHVESVAWASERKDVLSAVFMMLALLAYETYARRPGLRRYLLVVAMFSLGLMSKPMLVTFPFLLLLIDYWPLRRWAFSGAQRPLHQPVWRLIAEKAPLLLLALVSCYVTLKAQAPGIAALNYLPISVRAANAASSYVNYAAKTLWPVKLTAFYPYPKVQSGWWMVACLLGLWAVSLAVVREVRRRPYLAVGWFWYLGTLVPVIGLVQVGDQSMADRYSYIPIIGLFIMAAWAGRELAERRPALLVSVRTAAACAVLACMIAARAQTGHWRDTMALWTHSLAVSPNNYVAESGVGSVLLSQGKLKDAIAHYEKALVIAPQFSDLYNALGATLMKYGHVREALPYLIKGATLKPEYGAGHSNLGLAMITLGDVDKGISHLREALRLQPDSADIHGNLAIALVRQDRMAEAVSQFNEALRIDPDYADGHYNLAVVLFEKKKFVEAAGHLRTTLRLRPDHEDARQMLDDLERGTPRP